MHRMAEDIPSVPPEGAAPPSGSSAGGPAVPPEGTTPQGKAIGPESPQMSVAPEGTRTIIGSGGIPEGTRPLREAEVPAERSRLMPLDDSSNE
jgi:hypothetical protein